MNKYRNYFGKSRVVVIKSQLGQPIVAYSGDEVYWKIPKDLPKMTKLMIDVVSTCNSELFTEANSEDILSDKVQWCSMDGEILRRAENE